PLSSPEHLKGAHFGVDDIWEEQPPADMKEMALTEELCQVQENFSRVQTLLNEEELKNNKLLQQIAKLEEQITLLSQESEHKGELLSTERAKNRDQLSLRGTVSELQRNLQSEQRAAEVMRSEISDLRLVLKSSDKELAAVKNELTERKSEQQREMGELSNSLIGTQLRLDKVQLEWEQLLEQHRMLQDSFDQLQAETKFEADQARRHLQDRRQEIDEVKTQLMESNNSLQTEQEHTTSLTCQLRENKESTSKELIDALQQSTQLRKQVSDVTLLNQQQASKIVDLEQNLFSGNEKLKSLEQKIEHDKDVVLDLINQIRDLRCELSQRDQTVAHLSADMKDITAKYDSTCLEREDVRKQNSKMQTQVLELKETLDRCVASNATEVEVLQEVVTYSTEEVERLTKVLDEQSSLLQASRERAAQKDVTIQNLQQKVKQQQETAERTVRSGSLKPCVEQTVTPKSLPRSPFTPGSFSRDLTQVLMSQEEELENRRTSMMTMEILLAELNAERAAKNEEIHRLKTQLTEKEMVRMEIQALLDQFYTKQNQNGNNSEGLNDAINQSMHKELQEERAEKNTAIKKLSNTLKRLQAQEAMLAQSQTCVQELTAELRDRCLDVRELRHRIQEEEKLLQENEVLRKQNVQLSEENGKLVGHKNHKQRIEYLVKLKKENTKLQEENEKLRSEMLFLQDPNRCPPMEMM
ncbi:kinesin-like protein KIF15, partial [Brachionichthys hirsutus]|uniref:kinesin-like protein KIF15 n=1 Tax=Brachionichthys hirsutus TaxID=412623 RepID=UPI0036052971